MSEIKGTRYYMPRLYMERVARINERLKQTGKGHMIVRQKQLILLGTAIAALAEKRGKPLPYPEELGKKPERISQAGWIGTRALDPNAYIFRVFGLDRLNEYADKGIYEALRKLDAGKLFHEICLEFLRG